MNNPFDFSSEQPCLQFLKQDSSQNNSDLFKPPDSDLSRVKIEEEVFLSDYQIQLSDKNSTKKRNPRSTQNKSKKKAFYRDKMASLMQEQGNAKDYYHYADYAHSGRGKSPITRDQQLRRNRESAKQSRQRRKEYVQTLQQKNMQYKQMIQELSMKLHEAEMERDRLKEANQTYIKSFITSKSQAYEKLGQILQSGTKNCKNKIGEELKKLKSKYGAAGSERIATTDYYVKEIIQILIGDIHKYLVACAINNTGLFGLGEWTNLDDNICQILNINKPVRVGLSQKFREKMMKEFQTFKDISQNFYDAYRSVQSQAKIIQRIFDDISLEFDDDAIARLLLWLEENKFHKDIKKMRAFWVQSVEEKEEPTDKVRKIPKNS